MKVETEFEGMVLVVRPRGYFNYQTVCNRTFQNAIAKAVIRAASHEIAKDFRELQLKIDFSNFSGADSTGLQVLTGLVEQFTGRVSCVGANREVRELVVKYSGSPEFERVMRASSPAESPSFNPCFFNSL